jgi:hypothetical protein
VSHLQFYHQLQSSEPALDKPAPLHAHMDGGSMVTTCDRLDYLWQVTWYSPTHHVPTLLVACYLVPSYLPCSCADNHDHFPKGEGYLHVPTMHGSASVHCYYMPSLPAMIVSPDAMGKQFWL